MIKSSLGHLTTPEVGPRHNIRPMIELKTLLRSCPAHHIYGHGSSVSWTFSHIGRGSGAVKFIINGGYLPHRFTVFPWNLCSSQTSSCSPTTGTYSVLFVSSEKCRRNGRYQIFHYYCTTVFDMLHSSEPHATFSLIWIGFFILFQFGRGKELKKFSFVFLCFLCHQTKRLLTCKVGISVAVY